MKKKLIVFLIFVFAISVNAQSDPASLELAKSSLKAHGGEKLSQVKNVVIKGAADVSAPGSTQTLPVGFAIIVAGEKYRFEIQSGLFNFQQISDGFNTSSSMAGFNLPPMNREGLFILSKIEQEGFFVNPLPEKFKKKKGFRISAFDGYYTDFIIDEKTFLVKEYESSFNLNGRKIETTVAIDKYRQIDGVMIYDKFSQRLELGAMTTYASFKAKDILVNSEVSDELFAVR